VPPEDHPIDLNAAVASYVGPVVVGLGVAVVVLLLLVIFEASRIGRLQRRIDALTRGADGSNLDGVIAAHLDKVVAVGRELDDLAARSAWLEASGRHAIQRVALVRFNPFEDTGGNQSFAVALVDAVGTGVVISSLHSRTGTRIYAKTVAEGRSDGALSAEEQEALRRALDGAADGRVPTRGADRAPGSA
jgi:hypothetical protein